MKAIIMLAVFLLPGVMFGQNAGIKFTEYASWNQVLVAAKGQKKNIFIDAYTTWCGPCKKMDVEVYPNPRIGKYINDHFIAVKIQFDRTEKDQETVTKWYEIATDLQKRFSINAFPTMLFVSSEDQLFGKIVGFYGADTLLTSIININDPEINFLKKLEKYKAGSLTMTEFMDFAIQAKDYKYDSIAFNAAKLYKLKIIDTTKPQKLISPKLRVFMIYFGNIFSVNDPLSRYIYAYKQSADLMFKEKYAQSFIEYLATRTYIDPLMFPYGKLAIADPDWDLMEENIRKKYDKDLAYKLTINAKVGYYTNKKDWQNAIKYMINRTDYLGLDTSAFGALSINNMVYDVIFKYSTDTNQLRKGMKYMEVLLSKEKNNYFWIDTYANILYKAGMRQKAITEQKRAVALAEEKNDLGTVKELKIALEKMQHNVSLWTE